VIRLYTGSEGGLAVSTDEVFSALQLMLPFLTFMRNIVGFGKQVPYKNVS